MQIPSLDEQMNHKRPTHVQARAYWTKDVSVRTMSAIKNIVVVYDIFFQTSYRRSSQRLPSRRLHFTHAAHPLPIRLLAASGTGPKLVMFQVPRSLAVNRLQYMDMRERSDSGSL